MMKTIKELSMEIGISKVSIYKAIKRPEIQPFVSKTVDNVTVVNETGVTLLISHFNQEKSHTIADMAENVLIDNGTGNYDSNHILTVLKDELNQKNNEINSLLKIITNQQTLDGQRLIKDRHGQLLLTNVISPQPIQQSRTGFLSRIFRRNKI